MEPETDVSLRAITELDLPRIMAWRTTKAVSDFMYSDFEPNLARQKEWFSAISGDNTRLDWLVNVAGVEAGVLSITRLDSQHHRCDWAYYLGATQLRGKGVGRLLELNVLRYVFEELVMNKLCCEVLAANEKVVELHERYGSQVEGRRRAHILKRGVFLDVIEMGILRADWE
ncbi:MAG: hypothetical protein RL701_2758, partial [Pseudomonadota bacterium]